MELSWKTNLNLYLRHPIRPTCQNSAWKRPQRRSDSDFLSICDRLSTGYDSGYYWEDVQRALRIAAGLEKWPD